VRKNKRNLKQDIWFWAKLELDNLHTSSLMMEAVRTSETSVDNHFTRQYNPEDSSELHTEIKSEEA
jgi:hypothetical protein